MAQEKKGGLVKLGLTVARDRAAAYVAFNGLRVVAITSALLAAPGIAHMAFVEHGIPDFNTANGVGDVLGKVVDGAGLIFGGAAVATGTADTAVSIFRRRSGDTVSFKDFLHHLESSK